YVLDTTAPTLTVSGVHISADSGSSATDFLTHTAAQTITGTLSAALSVGDILYGSVDNGTTWTDITAKAAGTAITWDTATLAGSSSVLFKVTDVAGNDGTTTGSQAYVLDTVAPTTTVATMAFSADTAANGTTNADFNTHTAAQTISGTLSANLATGEAVYVSLDNGASWTAATDTVGQNTWSLAGQTLTASNTLQVKVTDLAGNDGTSASQAYVLDTTAPVTTIAIMALSADTGVSASDWITNTAAQTISGTLSANLATGETVYVSLNNGATWTPATATVGQNTWSLAGQTLAGSNTFEVKVTDIAGNDGPVASHAYGLDTTAPGVSSVTSTTADGAYGMNSTVHVRIDFSEAVTVTGTPTLTLETGTTDRTINYVSGSGSSALFFDYTVQAGDTNSHLDYVSTNALAFNGGTIQDAAGNNAILTLATPGTLNALGTSTAIAIDGIAPTVSSVAITSATGILNNTLNAGDVVSITATLSEATFVTGTPQLALDIGGTTVEADYVSGGGSTALLFHYTIQANQTDANGISIAANSLSLNGGTLVDAVGNAATLTHGAVADHAGYLVDTTAVAPTLALASDTGSSASDGVTSNGQVNVTGLETGAMWQYSTDSGSTWTTGTGTSFTVSGDGFHSVLVQQTDLAGNTSANSSALTLTLDATAPQWPPLSFARTDLSIGATFVTVADLNGDGQADMLVSNYNSGIVSVLLGNGNGTFQAHVDYSVGASPQFLAMADVNGDGRADLLVSNRESNTVSVLLGNGDGTLQSRLTANVGSTPLSIASTDLNGDGKADISVVNFADNTVSVLLSNGNGTFQSRVNYTVGAAPQSVTMADVNGDGKTDMLVANSGSNTVSVLLGNGDGIFQPKTDYAAGSNTVAVTTADVNGDGKLDILTTNWAGNTVSVLLGNGNGTFQTHSDYGVGTGPVSVTAADVNGDGKIDILVTNASSNTLSVLPGNGDGTFQTRIDYATGSGPSPVAVVDVNGDGRADVLVGNNSSNTVSVLLNGSSTPALAPVDDTGVSHTDHITNKTAFTVTGAGGESGALVTLYDGATSVGTATVAGDGTWSVAVTGMSEATHSLTARQTDTAGNVSVASSALSVTVDTTAAAAPTLALASDTGSSASDGITCNGQVNVSGLETGDSWQYSTDGGSTWTTGTGTGFMLIGDGSKSVMVHQTDVAGNTSAASSVLTFTLDTMAVVPTLALANDTGGSAGDLITSNGQVNVTGLETGAAWQYSTNGGSTWTTGTGTGFMVSGDGFHSVLVHQTDLAGNTGINSSALAVTLDTTAPVFLPGPFSATHTDYDTGASPFFVTTADVNGDGHPDILTANFNGGNISVLLGNGDGTFQTRTDVAVGYHPNGMAAADVNRDGKTDLLVTNFGDGTVSVLLGNGDGTFQPAASPNIGSAMESIAAVDVNGDGKLDMVTANGASNTVSVLLGNGDGTFQAQSTYNLGLYPVSLSMADVNGDGKADILVANLNSSTVSVLLGYGDGTFHARVDYATGTTARSVTSADVNGDGQVDILVANSGGGSVSVLLGNGNGTFQNEVEYTVGFQPNSVAAADVNGDGKVDILAANYGSGTASVLLGNGDGTFQPKIDYSLGTNPWTVATADVNGDGKTDAVVINSSSSTVSVLLNDSNTPTLALADDTGVSHTDHITNATTFTVTGVGGEVGATVTLYDGATNLGTATVANDGTWSKVVTGMSAGTHSFTDTFTDMAGNVGAVSSALSVTVDTTPPAAPGGGALTFASKVDYGVGSTPCSVISSVDVNGDGKADLLVANDSSNTVSVLLNNGDGTFATKVDYATGTEPFSVFGTDVNGDGKADLLVASDVSNTVSVLLNNGNGTFASKVDYAAGSGALIVYAADVNGDGKPDLLVANHVANTVSVLLNNGNGTFASKADYATGTAPSSVFGADVNGDGKTDLLVANANSNTVSVLLNNGNGTFAGKVDYATGMAPKAVVATDVNGDGNVDLIVTNEISNTVSIFLNNGNGTFASKVDYATGSGPTYLSSADMNGDGRPDIEVTNCQANTVSVLLNNGNGTFAAKVDYATGSNPFSVSSTDVNGDGRADLEVLNYSSNNVSVLLNQSGFLSLAPADDTGLANTDHITGHTTGLTISGSGTTGATVTLFDDANNNGVQDGGEAALGSVGVIGGFWSTDIAL
ncbi:MAG: VCBS repeat-containing protein, partial [Magnetococcales bacterium]|nr:VCBS repeat-containing protein [Magnetococcales bacterium]